MARETVENTQAQANGVNMETIHFVLDMIGMIPALGEFADAANVVLYMAEGNYKMAALSAAAMVPVIGSLAAGGKIASKVLGKMDTAKDAIKKTVSNGWGWLKKTGSKVADVVSDGARTASGFLNDRLGNSRGSNNINAALFGIPGLISNKATKNIVKEVDLYYKTYNKNIPEFERQLKEQEDGINELSVGELRANIKEYQKNGRHKSSGSYNQKVRKNHPGITRDIVVLHNPDMVLGGYYNKNLTLGDASVNSSLGSQNRRKQAEVLKSIEGLHDKDYVKFNFKHK